MIRGIVPYVVLLVIGLFIVWLFPELSLWLPRNAGFGTS